MRKAALRSPLRSPLTKALRSLFSWGGSTTAAPSFTVLFEPLTNSTGTVTTLAYINAATGSGDITVSASTSRSSGVAPLLVHFDATATTSTLTTRPFHDLEYRWDFGDGNASTWSNGAQAGVALKRTAKGPVAAYVYETNGTHTPTLQVRYRNSDGSFTSAPSYSLTAVAVTAADTEWATAKTVSYSTTTDHTGAPSGCTQVSNVTDLATSIAANKGSGNRRHLLRAGQAFTSSAPIAIDTPGPSMIGKFGAGAKPTITSTDATGTNPIFHLSSNATPTTVTDWRFQDLDCNGGALGHIIFFGNGYCGNMLIHRCDSANTQGLLTLTESHIRAFNSAPNTPHAMWDKFGIVESTMNSLYLTNGNGMFVNSVGFAAIGNSFDTNGLGEHAMRVQLAQKGVFSHNTITGVVTGKHHLTLRGLDFAGTNAIAAGTYSEYNIVSNNKFTGGVNNETMTIQSQFNSSNERGRNYIVEGNWFDGNTTNSQTTIKVAYKDVTVRNNVTRSRTNNGGAFVVTQDEDSSGVWFPDRVNVYNNSFYHPSTGSNSFRFMSVQLNTAGVTLSGCTFDNKNNILYAPSASNMGMVSNGTSATVTSSNNTADPIADNPLFATVPPTTLAHFTPGGGSYAAGAGTSVKVCADLYGTNTDTTPDMGAVRIA